MNSPDLLARVEPPGKGVVHHAAPASAIADAEVPFHGQEDGHHHVALYSTIDTNPEPQPIHLPKHLTLKKSGHALYKALGDVTIQSSCTGTCCAVPGGGGG
jgi:hypothetical protein